jgi:hypothetical protein
MKCPHCQGSGEIEDPNEPNSDRVAVARELLERDRRRDIYETRGGRAFAISYMGEGMRSPLLTRADCEQLVRDGLIFEDAHCKGWFHKIGWTPNTQPSL